MSVETQYYTIVESKEHLNYINNILSEKGVISFISDRELKGYHNSVIYYEKSYRGSCQHSGLLYAEENGYERKDILMFCIPNELFEMS